MDRSKAIGFVVKTLSNQVKRQIDISVSKCEIGGITGMQCWIIGYLCDNVDKRDVFQKDVEIAFNIRRSTATVILQLMEKNGLITREAVSCDARLKKLILTEKAFDIHLKIETQIIQVEQKIAKGLTDEEIETFLRLVNKISKNIE
ncbi:MarR family transcriptional regulator [Clostridium estertheticum]|uniref:MarR family winged helix-turn-helix transcriptional regulator n=1 Tax=Clostridium estertheticum TaxID=238834 RepID=UPI001C7D844E|nr:MarR family transcriptional regulator [Clostridium estertheticum]MBX4259616.1 MarR family transcriptional regulator [Clostridium estertheticum]WLC70558.1 MarR family transcriptional regulator [Clostridium estertheticum]